MMKSKLKLMPVLVSVILINGCTVFPGSNMSTMGKDVIKQQDADFDINRMVNVYPLTPRLVEQLRPRPNVAQPNMSLDQEISQGESVNILLKFTQFVEASIEYLFQVFTAHSCNLLLPSDARFA